MVRVSKVLRHSLILTLQMSYSDATLSVDISGDFDSPNPLGNVTIAGLEREPRGISLNGMKLQGTSTTFLNGVLRIVGLERVFTGGVFQRNLYMIPVTQIEDGQIPVPGVTQAADGQVQATGSVG